MWPISRQLRLMYPDEFEALCVQLGKCENPQVARMGDRGGDHGIDFYVGGLFKGEDRTDAAPLRVWQVKAFEREIGKSQRLAAERSLRRVFEKHEPEQWTLCVPFDLNPDEKAWWAGFQGRHTDINCRLWEGATIEKMVVENPQVADAFFLRPESGLVAQKFDALCERLAEFEAVEKILARHEKTRRTPDDFFAGAAPTWSNIVGNHDALRECHQKLLETVSAWSASKGAGVQLMAISGRLGDGRTTALMRLAASLVSRGGRNIFYLKEDVPTLRAEFLSELQSDEKAVLLIDDFTSFDPERRRLFLRRLDALGRNVLLVATVDQDRWAAAEERHGGASISLAELTDVEIDGLLQTWSRWPRKRREYLGRLANLSPTERRAALRDGGRRQLLPAMLEAKAGAKFDLLIDREVNRALRRGGVKAHAAVSLVAAVHCFGLPMPTKLLKALVPELVFELGVPRGTEDVLLTARGRTELVTRHPAIAKYIVDKRDDATELYTRIFAAMEADHERYAARLFHHLTLRVARTTVKAAYRAVGERFPKNAVLKHMFGVWASKNGRFDEARKALNEALALRGNENYTRLSLAILEQRAGNIDEATRCFKAAAAEFPNDAAVFLAWAGLERSRGNLRQARKLIDQAVACEPTDAYVRHLSGTMWVRAGNVVAARREFRKALRANRFCLPALVDLARLEANEENFGAARRQMKKALKVAPHDVRCILAAAGIEVSSKNWKAARRLFRRALDVDSNNVAALTSWGCMEIKAGRLDGADESETAVRLLGKAKKLAPKDPHVLTAQATLHRVLK